MKKTPPYVISHFPHPSGWRYSWIAEDGERHETESFESMREARLAAKEKDKEFDEYKANKSAK